MNYLINAAGSVYRIIILWSLVMIFWLAAIVQLVSWMGDFAQEIYNYRKLLQIREGRDPNVSLRDDNMTDSNSWTTFLAKICVKILCLLGCHSPEDHKLGNIWTTQHAKNNVVDAYIIEGYTELKIVLVTMILIVILCICCHCCKLLVFGPFGWPNGGPGNGGDDDDDSSDDHGVFPGPGDGKPGFGPHGKGRAPLAIMFDSVQSPLSGRGRGRAALHHRRPGSNRGGRCRVTSLGSCENPIDLTSDDIPSY